MGLFSKKSKPEEAAVKLDFMTRAARAKILRKAEKAIGKSYKEHRITFHGGGVYYIDKSGNVKDYSLDALANLIWGKLNDELMSHSMGGQSANMAMLGITTEDIRNIILKLKEPK